MSWAVYGAAMRVAMQTIEDAGYQPSALDSMTIKVGRLGGDVVVEATLKVKPKAERVEITITKEEIDSACRD